MVAWITDPTIWIVVSDPGCFGDRSRDRQSDFHRHSRR